MSDAAVLLVIKSLECAQAEGDHILATIEREDSNKQQEPQSWNLPGDAHAAAGLLNIVGGIQQLRAGLPFSHDNEYNTARKSIIVHNESRFGETSSWHLHQAADTSTAVLQQTIIHVSRSMLQTTENRSLATSKLPLVVGEGPCRAAPCRGL